jgi:hypothetical protein
VAEAVILVLLKVILPLVVLKPKPTGLDGLIDHVPAGKKPLAGCGAKTVPLLGLLPAHRGLARVADPPVVL